MAVGVDQVGMAGRVADAPVGRVAASRGPRHRRPVATARAAAAAASRPVTPAVRAFLELAAIQDARLDQAGRDRIVGRVQAVETIGDARGCLGDVTARLRARRAGAGRPT